jgi:Bacterial pre-peptidase C-terminal domain
MRWPVFMSIKKSMKRVKSLTLIAAMLCGWTILAATVLIGLTHVEARVAAPTAEVWSKNWDTDTFYSTTESLQITVTDPRGIALNEIRVETVPGLMAVGGVISSHVGLTTTARITVPGTVVIQDGEIQFRVSYQTITDIAGAGTVSQTFSRRRDTTPPNLLMTSPVQDAVITRSLTVSFAANDPTPGTNVVSGIQPNALVSLQTATETLTSTLIPVATASQVFTSELKDLAPGTQLTVSILVADTTGNSRFLSRRVVITGTLPTSSVVRLPGISYLTCGSPSLQINIDCLRPGVQDNRPTITGALAMSANVTYVGTVDIQDDRSDYLQVNLAADQRISVTLRANGAMTTGADLDLYLYSYDPTSGNVQLLIGSALTGQVNESIADFRIPASGDYFVRVYAFAGAGTMPYQLRLTTKP